MTPDQIRSALENAEDLPIEALRAGVALAPELAPAVMTVIEKAASGAALSHGEWQLLFCGLHVLAAARDQSVYPAVMGLLGRSEEEMVDLFTDEYINTLARLLLGLFDGDATALVAALENQEMDGGARWAVFSALARLTWEGRVPLAVTLDVIDRFEREGLAEDGDIAWEGWQNAIMHLGIEDRAPKVRAAWAAGRFPLQREADRREWNALLAAAVADPRSEDRFIGDYIVPITDPVAALTEAEELGYAPPEMTVSPDGRTAWMKFDQTLGITCDTARDRPVRSDRPARATKVGRNAPCPCGSGKKYKRCCGGVAQALH
jgi:hypothetical protein